MCVIQAIVLLYVLVSRPIEKVGDFIFCILCWVTKSLVMLMMVYYRYVEDRNYVVSCYVVIIIFTFVIVAFGMVISDFRKEKEEKKE